RAGNLGQALNKVQRFGSGTEGKEFTHRLFINVRKGVEQFAKVTSHDDILRHALREDGEFTQGGKFFHLAELQGIGAQRGEGHGEILGNAQPRHVFQELVVLLRRNLGLLNHVAKRSVKSQRLLQNVVEEI